MTRHERRTEELLQLISDELIDVVFYAALRDSGNYDNARYRTRAYMNNTQGLRSEMYDELNEPHGLQKLKKIATKTIKRICRK